MILPTNLSSHKLKKPKGWSYPLKTTEIAEGLDVENVKCKFHIFYDNKPPSKYKWDKTPDNSFAILSLVYYGNLFDDPHFHMTVDLCKPEYRFEVNKIIKEDFFPRIKTWVANVQRVRYVNRLALKYRDWGWTTGPHFILEENSDTELLAKKIDLTKKTEA